MFKHRLDDFIDIEILHDQHAIGLLGATLRTNGKMLICHGCDDITEPIAGIVVLAESEEAWLLCRGCLQRVPVEGQLAS